MRHFAYLLIIAVLFGCDNGPEEPTQNQLDAPTLEKPKVSLLALLTSELEKSSIDDSNPFGLSFYHTSDMLLEHIESLNNPSLTVIKESSWDYKYNWRVDMQYKPAETETDPLLISAYNSTGYLMDMIIVKPMPIILATPIEAPEVADVRKRFVKQQMETISQVYDEPDIVVDTFKIPARFNSRIIWYNTGTAYFWMNSNKMITLVDVPFYPAVIYAGSTSKSPSAAQMMVISNAYTLDSVTNLWGILAPCERHEANYFSISLEKEGFQLNAPPGANSKFPSYIIKKSHPYHELKATLYPTGWHIRGMNELLEDLTEEQLAWNKQLIAKLIETQGKPFFVSQDEKVYYWLYNSYITYFEIQDERIDLRYLQFY